MKFKQVSFYKSNDVHNSANTWEIATEVNGRRWKVHQEKMSDGHKLRVLTTEKHFPKSMSQ